MKKVGKYVDLASVKAFQLSGRNLWVVKYHSLKLLVAQQFVLRKLPIARIAWGDVVEQQKNH